MRQWKVQVPFLARVPVITVEGRGNGAADRPVDPSRLPRPRAGRRRRRGPRRRGRGAGRRRRALDGCSAGSAARRLVPGAGRGVVAIGAALPWPLPPDFDEVRDRHEGWGKANRHYWKADYRGWVEFFVSQVFTEPHSSKQWEDVVGWGLETDAETCAHGRWIGRTDGPRRRGDLPGGALPGARRARRRGRGRALRDRCRPGRVDRRHAGDGARRRPRADLARPGAGSPC